MIDTWITPILVAIVFLYSKFYNTRRVEYPTYGLWNTVLTRLIPSGTSAKLYGDLGDCFVVAPQYEVYVSPKDTEVDPDDRRASTETRADADARSVFFDFAILLLRPGFRKDDTYAHGITTFLHYLLHKVKWLPTDRIYRVLQLARLRISDAFILCAIELKRPPPRSITIHYWVASLMHLLDLAQAQAFEQAAHVLRSVRYDYQRQYGLFLIAGAGEWFTLRWIDFEAIESTPPFQRDTFDEVMDMLMSRVKRDEALETSLLRSFPDMPLMPENECALDEREVRARKRGYAQSRAEVKKREQELSAMLPPFIDEDLQYYHVSVSTEEEYVETPFFLQQEPPNGIITLDSLKDWTRPMRLGSPVANKYLQFLITNLKRIAEDAQPVPASPVQVPTDNK